MLGVGVLLLLIVLFAPQGLAVCGLASSIQVRRKHDADSER
jgi:hypothetical protein